MREGTHHLVFETVVFRESAPFGRFRPYFWSSAFLVSYYRERLRFAWWILLVDFVWGFCMEEVGYFGYFKDIYSAVGLGNRGEGI